MHSLFSAMMKEEWRIHSTMFGSLGFASFPIMLMGFAFMGSFILPLFLEVIPVHQIVLITHYIFVILGVMVGSFGLLGREFMNRRFGQASLIAYSSRSLPVSERKIFVSFFLKDVVYYFFLWILPFGAGFSLAAPFIGIGLLTSLLVLVSITLSFLIGLSLTFFFSTVYAHSNRLLIALLAVVTAAGAVLSQIISYPLLEALPSFIFMRTPSLAAAIASILLILIPTIFSVLWIQIDFPEHSKRFRNHMDSLSRRLDVCHYPHLVAKDLLDLSRSEGGPGKIIFSLLIPLGLIWMFLSVLLRFIPAVDGLIVFAVLLGVLSSSMYNWLTEFDSFTAYRFLPVEVSTVIRSKLTSFKILSFVPLTVLGLAALGTGSFHTLVPSLAAFLSVSLYALAVTVYLTGLSPNIMLYNTRIFFFYIASISPVLLGLIFISVLHPPCVTLGIILIPVGLLLLKKSYEKWNEWDIPAY